MHHTAILKVVNSCGIPCMLPCAIVISSKPWNKLLLTNKGYCNSCEHAGNSPGSAKPIPGTTYLLENFSQELPTSGNITPRQ